MDETRSYKAEEWNNIFTLKVCCTEMKVEFFRHNIGGEEKQSIISVLDSIFLTTGKVVNDFEEKLSSYLGLQHCVGLSSCTAALHLGLVALGIGPGDEVITTPMTFVATSLAIVHAGAKPIWVDVEKQTGNINAELIEGAITERTKAIVPVHLYGNMCDMIKIKNIADKYGLYVIEDAAHALEAERDGVRVGELADGACFSFYCTKSITCGEGGAFATNRMDLAEKVRLLSLHGMTKGAAERYQRLYEHWDMVELGWKYNMNNIQAALLIPQLKKIECYWSKRKRIYEYYVDSLKDSPEIDFPKIPPNSRSAYHLFTIWVSPERRDILLKGLQEENIGVAVNYRAIHLLSKFRETFGNRRGDYPVAEKIGASTISLPLYPKLKIQEANYVIEKLKRIIDV